MKTMVPFCLALVVSALTSGQPRGIIVASPGDTFAERLAAKEVRRYLYLTTGELLSIERKTHAGVPQVQLALRRDLAAESYNIVSTGPEAKRMVRIEGGSPSGLLFGAYRFAHHLGVRFDLHEDVVPDAKRPFILPAISERRKPLFSVRGIQPFHDFPEGPDWWSPEDYRSYVSRLPRLGMNFVGFHCYPEGGVGPEPLVWIGRETDLNADSSIRAAYPSRWASTKGGAWGYGRMEPSQFSVGASWLFPDGYMPDAMKAPTPEGIFERAASQTLWPAFHLAHLLGAKVCVGTETPLTLPAQVRERLVREGGDLGPGTIREVYRAMFRRIQAAYPVDYYWLWTPEDWTWGGNKPEQYAATLADMRAALGALEDLGNPFQLATSGWVLGPVNDRAALDKDLPKSVPLSAINRQVGHEPIDPAFGKIKGRPTWAIPWLENDPNLVGYQPWVGRMRADAAQARNYGCTGLLGIHWRTASIGMNIVAIAEAGWDQSWAKRIVAAEPQQGALGGNVASFTAPVEDTDQDAVYQTVRYDVAGYRFKVPKGIYKVTLKFSEPHYGEPGKRVFGADIQGVPLVRGLDLVARVGKNHALDLSMAKVIVKDGWLKVDFIKEVEYPCIAGIEVVSEPTSSGKGRTSPFALRINCGGPKWGGFNADMESSAAGRARTAPVADLYRDWAAARFGPEAGKEIGAVFASLDGVAFPQLSDWIEGPGGLPSVSGLWEQERRAFDFLPRLEKLRPKVRGAGHRARLDVWLERFRSYRAMRELTCLRGRLDRSVAVMKGAAPAARASLAGKCQGIRVSMARLWEAMLTHQIASIETPGEMGTIANLEMHTRVHNRFLSVHDAEIEAALSHPLPTSAFPRTDRGYQGSERLFMPTHNDLDAGSLDTYTFFALTQAPLKQAVVWCRPMGSREPPVRILPTHKGGFRWEFRLPAGEQDMEFWIGAVKADGKTLRYPADPHQMCTVLSILPRDGQR
ncbi:MAG: hypothetical protein HZC36_00365 [Armatimonadetes bacterium]|nr:hypothetical protein [Armatimonadota bacterium]